MAVKQKAKKKSRRFMRNVYKSMGICGCGNTPVVGSTFVCLFCGMPKQRPTKRTPDAGDSAASQTLSPQSGESTPEVNPAATQRR